MDYQAWFWLAMIILFLVIEMITISLVSIWFVGGALAAFIVSYFTGNIWIEVVVFLAVSVLLLVLLRPLARKLSVKQKDQMVSGAKAMIGRQAVVTEEIDNVHARGAVQVNGQYWTAKTELFKDTIPKDTIVDIIDVDGVKLIVRKAGEKE
ncbi:MAG: NfeD family protein [Lachnospiraceae bacterium]|nr:NfeD family protein [Lachnospiraceae bacterium]